MKNRLAERYIFDWKRIEKQDSYHIEYCVTDICNRNCTACSHLAPLAKQPNFVTIEQFSKVVKIIQKCMLDVHTFWLTGGEPTLHPEFLQLLKIAREVFSDSYVGIYSNGSTLKKYETDEVFWDFIGEQGIVWGITSYDADACYFEEIFSKHGCLNNLVIVQSGKLFFNLTNYSKNQPITMEKYQKCGWERSKINVRNGKIYNCPSVEFAELFNNHFDAKLRISQSDYLTIDETLTLEKIEKFRGPIPFCSQCDLNKRYKKIFKNEPSKKNIEEWACLEL